jgi:hypothetical protein
MIVHLSSTYLPFVAASWAGAGAGACLYLYYLTFSVLGSAVSALYIHGLDGECLEVSRTNDNMTSAEASCSLLDEVRSGQMFQLTPAFMTVKQTNKHQMI